MRAYQVTSSCYVPVGTGYRFKQPGQIVHLSAEDAAELGDLVASVSEVGSLTLGVQFLNTSAAEGSAETVQELNTEAPAGIVIEPRPAKARTKAKADPGAGSDIEAPPEGVSLDAGEPGPADERAAGQD